MARDRVYGSDTPFMAWMRAHPRLPANGTDCGFVATDNDITIQRYKTSVDSIGTRELQSMMDVEIKTRGATPSPSQLDTLWKRDLFRGDARTELGEHVRFYGCYVLMLSGTTPDDSDHMRWGRFARKAGDAPRHLRQTVITQQALLDLFLFERHPDSLTPRPLRRHHKTNVIQERRVAALGFEHDVDITERS